MEVTNQNNGRSSFDTESRNVTPSKAGTKRLFSNRGSKQLNGYEGAAELDIGEDGVQSGKRPRNSDWPLPKASPPSAKPAQRYRNGTQSPPTRRASSQVRPSRFMEGSMNDKISQKPPAPYIGDEHLREQYEEEEEEFGRGRTFARPRKPSHHNEESSVASRSETSKHSLFRFGKSIAATFNPTNWKIWNKQPQVLENEETVQERILRERQEKAARIYQELKSSGEFKDTAIGADFYEPIEHTRQDTVKHDSGVNFNDNGPASSRNSREHSLSREEKRWGHVFQETPKPRSNVRGESPASRIPTSISHSNQSSPKFKKPSMASLRRSFISDSTPNLHNNDESRQARRIPSRKELQKQQKLVKRVSDLESKLEAARRQLIDTVGEPVLLHSQPNFERGRPRFVPGALPSLPSERLLSGYLPSEEEEIGRAVTTDHPLFRHPMVSHALVDDEKPRYARSGAPSMDEILPSVEKDGPAAPSIITQLAETDKILTSRFSDYNDADHEDEVEKEDTPKPKTVGAKEMMNIRHVKTSIDAKTVTVKDEDEETPKKPAAKVLSHPSRAAPQQPKTTPSRKRKSFVGHADDGGEYEPDSEPEPTSESELSTATSDSHLGIKTKPKGYKARPIKRTSAFTPAKTTIAQTRPRKLQKNSPTTSSPKGDVEQPLAKKKSLKDLKLPITSPSSMPTASNRLIKSKIPNLAPPQAIESDFSGLQYSKPSTARPTPIIHEDEDADDVPPVPKLPKTVRMPSGEIVSTEKSNLAAKKKNGSVVSKASSSGSKLTKVKKEVKTEDKENVPSVQGKQSFEWPEDVF